MNVLHAKLLAVFNGEDTLVGAVRVGAGLFNDHTLSPKLVVSPTPRLGATSQAQRFLFE